MFGKNRFGYDGAHAAKPLELLRKDCVRFHFLINEIVLFVDDLPAASTSCLTKGRLLDHNGFDLSVTFSSCGS